MRTLLLFAMLLIIGVANSQTLTPHPIDWCKQITPTEVDAGNNEFNGFSCVEDENNATTAIHWNPGISHNSLNIKAGDNIFLDGEVLLEPTDDGGGQAFLRIEPSPLDIVWFDPNPTPGFVERYDKLELGVELPASINQSIENYILNNPGTKLNPFNPDDISVEATFWYKGSGGSPGPYKVYGFYYREFERNLADPDPTLWTWDQLNMTDGVNSEYNFRVRFAPPTVGEWKCEIKADIAGVGTLTAFEFDFDCTSSSRHGYMTVGPNKRYFQIDGQTYIPGGKNFPGPENGYYYNPAWGASYDGPTSMPHTGEELSPAYFLSYLRSLEEYKDTGGEYFRLVVYGKDYEIEWEQLGNYYNRMDNAWEMDRLMDLLEQENMLMELNMAVHDMLVFPDNSDPFFDWPKNTETPVDPSNPPNPGVPGLIECQLPDDVHGNPYRDYLGLANPIEFLRDATAKEYYKRRLRYFSSRWGYNPKISLVEIMSEVDNIGKENLLELDCPTPTTCGCPYTYEVSDAPYRTNVSAGTSYPSVPSLMYQWHDEMGQYLKTHQYYPHLTAVSYTNARPAAGDLSYFSTWVDVPTYNAYNSDLDKFPIMVVDDDEFHHLTAKPMFHPEMGTTTFNQCDNGVGIFKDAWITPFTGSAGGINWMRRFDLNANQHLRHVRNFINGVNFDGGVSGNWLPYFEIARDDKSQLFALKSQETKIRAIGVVDNRTVNYWTHSTDCHSVGSPPSAPLDIADIIVPDNHVIFGPTHKLTNMGFLNRYNIDWYNAYTGSYIHTIEERSGAFGDLEIAFPTLSDAPTGSILAFKVRRKGEAGFLLPQDTLVQMDQVATIVHDWNEEGQMERGVNAVANGDNRLSASPNPTDGKCSISFDGPLESGALLTVLTSNGTKVMELPMTQNNLILDLGNAKPGLYLLQLITDGKSYVEKILVK